MPRLILPLFAVVLTAAVSFAFTTLASTLFTEPTATPPNASAEAPLNVGRARQEKAGALYFQSGGTTGGATLATQSGNVGIGASPPNAKLGVDGKIFVSQGLSTTGTVWAKGKFCGPGTDGLLGNSDDLCVDNPFACSDGVDNDGAQGADSADPDCHTDGDAGNPTSYNPVDTIEETGGGGGTPPPTSCTTQTKSWSNTGFGSGRCSGSVPSALHNTQSGVVDTTGPNQGGNAVFRCDAPTDSWVGEGDPVCFSCCDPSPGPGWQCRSNTPESQTGYWYNPDNGTSQICS